MYNNPFYIPGAYSSVMPAMGRSITPALGAATKGGGLFGRIGSAFGALRGVNWGGLINNASKTLGVINQTIPLVKQIGPTIGNMRSMLKIASVFKDETDNQKPVRRIQNNTNNYSNNYYKNNNNYNNNFQSNNEQIQNKEYYEKEPSTNIKDDSPTFFIN